MAATTGLDLKLKRIAHRVKAREIADEMGVNPSYITLLEGQARVTDAAAAKYLAALAATLAGRTDGHNHDYQAVSQ